MYQLDTVDKFNDMLEQCDHSSVVKLRQEIEDAIQIILMAGSDFQPSSSPPKLEIQLDDSSLYNNPDLFIQIVNKHLASERFQCYQQVKKLMVQHASMSDVDQIKFNLT